MAEDRDLNRLTVNQLVYSYKMITENEISEENLGSVTERLENIMNDAWATTIDYGAYKLPTIIERSAYQSLRIARERPFPSHNVNVAIISLVMTLYFNNIGINLTEASRNKLAVLLNNPETESKQIEGWIFDNKNK